MPSDATISFTFAGLKVPYCFTTPERFALDIAAGLAGYVPGQYTVVIKSETQPDVNDRDKLWYKPSTGHVYYYLGGWISKNPEEANGDARRIFVGAESDIWTYDGGDGTDPGTNPPTDMTGAMWERDTAFDFRFPLGAGTSSAPASTTVAVNATGGEENHTLTIAEMPAHHHSGMPGTQIDSTSGGDEHAAYSGTVLKDTDDTGDGDPHNNMPPYIGVYFVRRTARQFYVG